MKSYTVSIVMSINADSESEACEAAISQIKAHEDLYECMSVVCDREDLVLTNDSVRYWLEQLPEGYRELALANYGKRTTASTKNYADLTTALWSAFSWADTPEGYKFWLHVANNSARSTEPLPPLP